jgi:hypothetical protein
MDMNGRKGIFRVCVDIYSHSCSKLECLHENNELSQRSQLAVVLFQ